MKTKIAKIVALISSVTAMLLANSSLAAAPGAAGTSGIVVAPKEGEIGDEGVLAIRVTFPTPMVEIERIKQPGLPSPVLFEPTVETHWTWVSQTEGKLGIKEDWRFPRILHRAKLRPGLKDLAGQPVNVRDWGAEYMNEDFALRRLQFLNVWSDPDAPDDPDDAPSPDVGEESGDIESRKLADPLVAHPIVRLEFSRDVLAQDVAEAVYFQDRVTREKFPVQVNFEERQVAQAQGWFRVEPVSALPSGRSYLLVVDPLKAPKTGETLPHLRIVQAGTTFPLTVRRIVGLNQPVEGAFVRITVNHTIDSAPENLRLIDIQPAVKNLRFEPNEFTLDIRGDFNPATTYRVTLQAGLKSTAFDLEKDSAWTVRFHPKRPAIILTATEMFQPTSVRPVRHSFLQVNTQRLEWKVARIPREKVAEVQSRLREFAEILEEEKDGETRPARHLVSGEYKYRETESLIDVMGWPIVASDKVDASGDDREMKRQIQWNPETNAPGIYLLEITGKDFKGRAIGNRSIISRTDSVSTLISLGTGSIVRLRDVGSGKPMRGVPLQPIDGEEPSTPRQTDGNGEVYFEKGIGDSGLLVGPPGAESLHLLNLPPFPTGHWVDEPDANDDPVLKCAIVTDRNMYRPGETVKLKGFARTYKAGKLAIPVGSKIDWSVEAIAGITSEPPVYGETVVLPANGAWEGSWRISESALGDYFIKAGDAVQKITVSEFRPPAFSVRTTTETLPDGVVRAQISSMHFHGAPNVNAKVRWKAEWVVENWSNDDEQEEGEAEFDNAGLVLSDLCSQEATDQRLADEILSKAGWDTPRADRGLRISARVEGEATLDANGMATLECKSPFPKNTAYGRAKVYWIVDVTSAAAQTLRGGAVSKVQLVPQILGVRMSQSDLKTLYLEIASLNAEDGRSSGLAAKAEVFRVQMKTVKERLGPNLNRYRNSPTYEKVWEGEVTTPAEQKIKVPAAGYYMVRVAATRQPATPLVSDSEVMVGSESYEVGVLDDSGLACKPDRKEYEVGDTANIAVQSPYGGTAIVTVETDRILFRRVVELQGNAHRIALPVEESFAPNAWVCVNLLKPANAGGAPAERFGACEIKVRPTLRRLKVATSLAAEKTTPGANVVGNIIVSSGGKPVAGADVMIFAVD